LVIYPVAALSVSAAVGRLRAIRPIDAEPADAEAVRAADEFISALTPVQIEPKYQRETPPIERVIRGSASSSKLAWLGI
jgi:hypothetical protein